MCLDDQILNTYLDGELGEPWKTQVVEHLNYCVACNTRLEQLKKLRETLSSSALTEQEIQPHQEKVLSFIEKNIIEKKHINIFRKTFRVSMPVVMATAAAFVVILTGVLLLTRPDGLPSGQIIPNVAIPSAGSVIQVRATENLSAAKLLENFTLEEILQYLSSRGYEVEVKVKEIQPVMHQLEQNETDSETTDEKLTVDQ